MLVVGVTNGREREERLQSLLFVVVEVVTKWSPS
jgi:hypothetical protein